MPQPVLHTHRLRLRPVGDADLPGFIDIYANPVTAHFLGGLCDDEDAWRRTATMVGHVVLRGYEPWGARGANHWRLRRLLRTVESAWLAEREIASR